MAAEKKKSSNFNGREIEVLVDAILESKGLLFAKFGSMVTNAAKNEKWRQVTDLVNSASDGEVRTVDAVKKKWYDLASKTKRKESSRRKEMTATGGGKGEVVMTPEEVKVVEILGNEAIEGISGGLDVGFGIHEAAVDKKMFVQSAMMENCDGVEARDVPAAPIASTSSDIGQKKDRKKRLMVKRIVIILTSD